MQVEVKVWLEDIEKAIANYPLTSGNLHPNRITASRSNTTAKIDSVAASGATISQAENRKNSRPPSNDADA